MPTSRHKRARAAVKTQLNNFTPAARQTKNAALYNMSALLDAAVIGAVNNRDYDYLRENFKRATVREVLARHKHHITQAGTIRFD